MKFAFNVQKRNRTRKKDTLSVEQSYNITSIFTVTFSASKFYLIYTNVSVNGYNLILWVLKIAYAKIWCQVALTEENVYNVKGGH